MNIVNPSDNGYGPIIKEKVLNPREITPKSLKALFQYTNEASTIRNKDEDTAITIIINPAYLERSSLSTSYHNAQRVQWKSLAKEGTEAILANGCHRIALVKKYRVHSLNLHLSYLQTALAKARGQK